MCGGGVEAPEKGPVLARLLPSSPCLFPAVSPGSGLTELGFSQAGQPPGGFGTDSWDVVFPAQRRWTLELRLEAWGCSRTGRGWGSGGRSSWNDFDGRFLGVGVLKVQGQLPFSRSPHHAPPIPFSGWGTKWPLPLGPSRSYWLASCSKISSSVSSLWLPYCLGARPAGRWAAQSAVPSLVPGDSQSHRNAWLECRHCVHFLGTTCAWPTGIPSTQLSCAHLSMEAWVRWEAVLAAPSLPPARSLTSPSVFPEYKAHSRRCQILTWSVLGFRRAPWLLQCTFWLQPL